MKTRTIEFNLEDLRKDLSDTIIATTKYSDFVQECVDESEDITYKAFLPFLSLIDMGNGTGIENALVEATGRYIACHKILLKNKDCSENIKNTLKYLIDSIDSIELYEVKKELLS